jgi:hypothetical protein
MDPQLRARAEARLTEAAQAQGIADPRPSYRDWLRRLRQNEPDAFDRAIRHYERQVLPALREGDPLPAWIEYGRFLATLTAAGDVVRIDEQGRAAPWTADSPAGLVLFIPGEAAADVMVLSQPISPTDAQHATIALLVERKLRL